MKTHVVVGSGPLGRATARQLGSSGVKTRIVSRNPPSDLPGVEGRSADANDGAALEQALEGAAVVYHCANAPYHLWEKLLPGIWGGIERAAASTGAKLVIGTNLYALGAPAGPLTEETPLAPCSRKGEVRARLETEAMAAHQRGDLQVSLVRASDFYGPEVTESALGERFFGAAIRGQSASLTGKADALHSYAYLPDFARTMVAVGTRDDTWGKTWIVPGAPAATGRVMGAVLERELGSNEGQNARRHRPNVTYMGKFMLRVGGLFVPAAREMVEMYYEFDRPFVVDSTLTESVLEIGATPLDRGFARTIEWYRSAWETGDTLHSGEAA